MCCKVHANEYRSLPRNSYKTKGNVLYIYPDSRRSTLLKYYNRQLKQGTIGVVNVRTTHPYNDTHVLKECVLLVVVHMQKTNAQTGTRSNCRLLRSVNVDSVKRCGWVTMPEGITAILVSNGISVTLSTCIDMKVDSVYIYIYIQTV